MITEKFNSIEELSFIVKNSECDPYRIAHNSNYFSWFEMGCLMYLRKYITQDDKSSEMGYVNSKVKCRFLKSCEVGDEIVVQTRLKSMTEDTYTFEQKMYRKSNSELMARCTLEKKNRK